MLETSSYHLSNKNIQFKMMNLKIDNYVEIANSQSADFNIMRYWMLPNLMQILKENTHNEYPQNLFESGTVFKVDDKEETGVSEFNRLAVVLCNKESDYTKIRQVLDYLLRSLGLKYEVKETEHPSFIPGRVGRVHVKGKKIAYIGEILSYVLNNFELEMPVAAFELNLTEIFNLI